MRQILTRAVAVAAVLMATLSVAARPSAALSYPVNWNALSAIASGVAFDVPPPGANRPLCRPGTRHPRPVILVHGLTANQSIAWQALAPTLANDGYCVYTLTYGKTWYSGKLGGIDDISAGELAAFVDTVRAWTGTSKVELVGHSEGGNIARLYLKTYGTSKVSTYVSLAGVNMGPPTLSGLITAAQQIPGAMDILTGLCPACGTLTDPAYFTALNTPSATFPEVRYVAVASTHDEAVTPYTLALLPAAPNVTDITIQGLCPDDRVGHLGIPYDRTAVALVRNALDPANPVAVPCDDDALPL